MLYLFSTTIMPNEGTFKNQKVSLEKAGEILQSGDNYHYQGVSALGHQGAADAFNACFPSLNCEVNRVPAIMHPRDEAIALKVLGRLPEGQILTKEELEKVGYDFFHIVRTE